MSLLEKKSSLSLLFIESLIRSEEGRGAQQNSELLNKAFSKKSVQYISRTYAIGSLMGPCFQRINEVCSSWRSNRHTLTHLQNDYIP